MTEIPLWERQEGETEKAYEAFALYRDMGVNRSTREVAKRLGKSTALIHRWSSANGWVARAELWDARENERMQERNEQRRIEVEQNAWRDYAAMRRAIDKRVQTYEVSDWTGNVNDIHGLLDLMRKADDLARRAVGLPDKITDNKHEVNNTGPAAILVTKMDIDEL